MTAPLLRHVSGQAAASLAMAVALTAAPSAATGTGSASGLAFTADLDGLVLSNGFRVVVVSAGVGPARHLAVRDNGDIYVALQQPRGGGGMVALRDTDGDGRADRVERFGSPGGTGIRIHAGYVYFATVTGVLRYRLRDGDLLPDAKPEVVVEGFPSQRSHADKSIAFDGDGSLYVNIGAPSNAGQRRDRTPGMPGEDPCPELERQAGIWRFDVGKLHQKQTDGERFATGIRQALAMSWSPRHGELYVVQHGRDQLHSLWPDRFTQEQSAELPAEEFLLVRRGDNFGWPYCYYDHLQGRRVTAPEYGGDGTLTNRCAGFIDPILAFPGHWAPNDLQFYAGRQFPPRYHGGAFIAFHGSWDRAPLPQKGFLVAFVPFEGKRPRGGWEVFANGFAGKAVVAEPSEARFRPMGLAEGADGSLYVVDSMKGRIWRIVYAP